MQTIYLNGKPYSYLHTNLRKAEKVITAWKIRMEQMGYSIPEGEYTAAPYQHNALDNYGV